MSLDTALHTSAELDDNEGALSSVVEWVAAEQEHQAGGSAAESTGRDSRVVCHQYHTPRSSTRGFRTTCGIPRPNY
jgi:hypothetical protein